MEVHRRFRFTGRAGCEPKQRNVVATRTHRLITNRLVQCDAIEFGIVIGGAIEPDHLLQEAALLGTRHQLVHQPRVAQCDRDLGLINDLRELAGAQHRHRVHNDGPGLRRRQPARHHRRVVRRTNQHPVAGLDAVVLGERVRHPVRPIGEFFVCASSTVADQRDVITKTLLDHAVGQLDSGVDVLGIPVPIEHDLRPLLGGRQVVAGERVDVGGRAQSRFRRCGHGTTAVASISTCARRSTSATTCTSDIAG